MEAGQAEEYAEGEEEQEDTKGIDSSQAIDFVLVKMTWPGNPTLIMLVLNSSVDNIRADPFAPCGKN